MRTLHIDIMDRDRMYLTTVHYRPRGRVDIKEVYILACKKKPSIKGKKVIMIFDEYVQTQKPRS